MTDAFVVVVVVVIIIVIVSIYAGLHLRLCGEHTTWMGARWPENFGQGGTLV